MCSCNGSGGVKSGHWTGLDETGLDWTEVVKRDGRGLFLYVVNERSIRG